MSINIEYTDEFGQWYSNLSEIQQDNVASVIGLLEEKGTKLGFPYSSKINGSQHSKMRELRIQSQGNPLRVFYCFDPKRDAILLIGGDKTGDKRFYQRMIPIADQLYALYLIEIKQEGLI
jgi:hypothetical protein